MSFLYMFYKDGHSDDLYDAYFNEKKWSDNTVISVKSGGSLENVQSNYSPSVTVFNSKIYMIYKNAHSNDLYMVWSDDGKTWDGDGIKITVASDSGNPQSNYNPGVAVFENNLYIVYKGAGSNDLYTAWFDGATWYGNTKISDQSGGISPQSNYNPGVAVFKNNLYIVYKGAGSNDLYTAWFDGATWYGNTKISDQSGGISPQSNYNPGVTIFENNFYMVYKGASSNDLYTAWFDGTKWYGNTKISDQLGGIAPQSDWNPGIAVFGNSLYIVYKGTGSNTLYQAWFDDTNWYGNIKISALAGSNNAQSNYGPSLVCF